MSFLRNVFGKRETKSSSGGQVRTVYSFVAATIPLDAVSPMGKAMIQQIHPYACQNLCQANSTFKRLYGQVERKNSPHVLGAGMGASPEAFSDAFLAWLRSRGVIIDDIGPLVDEQVFLFGGNAQNPQDGRAFDWCVFLYFDTGQ